MQFKIYSNYFFNESQKNLKNYSLIKFEFLIAIEKIKNLQFCKELEKNLIKKFFENSI